MSEWAVALYLAIGIAVLIGWFVSLAERDTPSPRHVYFKETDPK